MFSSLPQRAHRAIIHGRQSPLKGIGVRFVSRVFAITEIENSRADTEIRFRKSLAVWTPAARCALRSVRYTHFAPVLVPENRRFSGSRKALRAFRTTSPGFYERLVVRNGFAVSSSRESFALSNDSARLSSSRSLLSVAHENAETASPFQSHPPHSWRPPTLRDDCSPVLRSNARRTVTILDPQGANRSLPYLTA